MSSHLAQYSVKADGRSPSQIVSSIMRSRRCWVGQKLLEYVVTAQRSLDECNETKFIFLPAHTFDVSERFAWAAHERARELGYQKPSFTASLLLAEKYTPSDFGGKTIIVFTDEVLNLPVRNRPETYRPHRFMLTSVANGENQIDLIRMEYGSRVPFREEALLAFRLP